MIKKLVLAFLILALPTTAASCGDDASAPGSATRANNEADASFAHGMIPHHEQALEMTRLAAERSNNPDVLDLAERIEEAQGPEIEQMKALLSEWGEPHEAEGGMEGHDMGGESMPGMMSDEEMAGLETKRGKAFDILFLEMMIRHHQGAIEMAEEELAEGSSPDATELAASIKSAQEAEIEEMNSLLEELRG
ncbi:MAG TPA: DUF305 domain-containing protein [Actinomycetota bacterium]|nr:DUF305 domain-containing protein [Actinomycetota bacterium]